MSALQRSSVSSSSVVAHHTAQADDEAFFLRYFDGVRPLAPGVELWDHAPPAVFMVSAQHRPCHMRTSYVYDDRVYACTMAGYVYLYDGR